MKTTRTNTYQVICMDKCCGFAGFKFHVMGSNYAIACRTLQEVLKQEGPGVEGIVLTVEACNKADALAKGKQKFFEEVFGK